MTKETKMKLIQAVKTWIAIYPTLLFFNYTMDELLNSLPMYARMFFMTVILVPFMVFVLMPLINKLFQKFMKQ